MNVGSLFTGIGGFDLGFERAGMRVAWQCECEPFARAVLARHWPGVPVYEDVRLVRGDAVEPVDVLCGGFPCQDISVAGRGAGIEGERSGLWREYARLVQELRPRWVVAENVPALRTRGYDRVADDLETAGYTVQAFVVGADDIGAPHRRKRVWIVAYAIASRLPGTERAQLPGAQRDDEGRATTERSGAHAWREGPPVPAVCELDAGIPPGLVRHRRPALAALGNALVPQIAEAIGRAIVRTEAAL